MAEEMDDGTVSSTATNTDYQDLARLCPPGIMWQASSKCGHITNSFVPVVSRGYDATRTET